MFFYPEFINGEKVLSRINGLNADMLMDITVYKFKKGEERVFLYSDMETAVLLIDGDLTFRFNGKEEKASRHSLFNDGPYCLHVSKNTQITLIADSDCEVLIQSTDNDRDFESKFYRPEDCDSFVSCEGKWENTAVRDVVTVFDYNNAPYSNMVLGEVYARQGRWWSYIPHSHPQPEVYYYKFERPEGFGACFIGETAHTVKDGSCGCFPGGYNHPQVTAPGYPMYNIWMIRHLDGNPWTDRIDDERYKWLLD
ncbi:MAG: 5-deoxy-glucuronate isomerase [Clostridia bacterium]|nr:5-deoxy-glucuronate isomerase [Clostridia bacterium]